MSNLALHSLHAFDLEHWTLEHWAVGPLDVRLGTQTLGCRLLIGVKKSDIVNEPGEPQLYRIHVNRGTYGSSSVGHTVCTSAWAGHHPAGA